MQRAAITASLDAALVTESELQEYYAHLRGYTDPVQVGPSGFNA
jgi:hypothetical protein